MIFTPLPLPGAHAIELEPRSDARGSFARLFCAREFADHGLNTAWVQCNLSSTSQRGTVRGMHFQRASAPEIKMVRCLAGAAFDVLVDVRRDSPAFGRWTALELSPANRNAVYIPPGIAHGFQALQPGTELLYFHSEFHTPASEAGLRCDDRQVAIEWPLPVTGLSPRDQSLPTLDELEPYR